jgi:hypothetical protein
LFLPPAKTGAAANATRRMETTSSLLFTDSGSNKIIEGMKSKIRLNDFYSRIINPQLSAIENETGAASVRL